MKAFDTDILTQIFRGNPIYADRVALIPIAEQALPILAAEEVLRGRLNTIRQAEAGRAKITTFGNSRFFPTFRRLKSNTKHGASRSLVAPRTTCGLPRFASLIR